MADRTVPSLAPGHTGQHPQKRKDTRKWENVNEKRDGTRLTHQLGTDKYRSKVPDGQGGEDSKTLPFKSKTEAQKWHDKRSVASDDGELPQTSQWTWDDTFIDLAAGFEGLVANGERAATTLERYQIQWRKHFQPKIGSKRVQRSAEGIGSRFLADWRKNPELSDITSLYRLLSLVCNHAVEKRILRESPLKAVPKRERPKQRAKNPPRVLTDEQCSALIASTPVVENDPERNRMLMADLALHAPRVMEGLGKYWQDLDLKGGVWHLEKQLARKKRGEPVKRVPLKTARREGGACRDIDLHSEWVKMAKRHKANQFAKGLAGAQNFAYTTSLGTPLTYKNFLDRIFNPAADKAGLNPPGVPKLTPHDLRHTAISRWIACGLDVVEVARQAGDTVAVITEVYAGEFDRATRAAGNRDKIAAGTKIALASGEQS